MKARVIDIHTRRPVEMEPPTEAFLRRELAQRDEQLAAALAENATLVATTRVQADQVAALRTENATLRTALALAEPCARWLRFWGIG